MYQFNNTLCISGTELIKSAKNPDGFLSKSYYDKLSRDEKNPIKIMRKGCYGTSALIAIESLPNKYQELIKQKFGEIGRAHV